MLSQVNLSEVPSRPFLGGRVSAMADWPNGMSSMGQGYSYAGSNGMSRSTAAQVQSNGWNTDTRACPLQEPSDLFHTDEPVPSSQLPRGDSRCDLAQYCPPPPPQFHDTAPFPPSMNSRGGVPVPRTQPPMFHSQAQAQPSQPSIQQQISRHQRILLFLRHCAKCTDRTRCVYALRCQSGKELWSHIFQCSNPHCTYRNCVYSRELLRHYQKCVDKNCPICGPVRSFVANDQGANVNAQAPF